MKKILIGALLLVAFNSYAKYYPGSLVFENGKSREGFIDSNLGGTILFKGWADAEPEEIAATSIKTVWLKTNEGHKMNEYRYLPVDIGSNGGNRMWLKLVEKGKVSLFAYETILQKEGSDKVEVLYYYCIREGGYWARLIGARNNALLFISKATEFFADKQEFVEKIMNKEYTWENAQQLVRDYNGSL